MKILSNYINNIKRIAFSSFCDTCITICIISLISICSCLVFRWLFFEADWDVVIDNFSLFSFGSYPSSQQWRPSLWLFHLLTITAITLFAPKSNLIEKLLPIFWISIIPSGIYLLSGGLGLLPVASRYWGGLTLTIFLMVCSSAIAFPFGIILAIGRQSNLPLIQYLSSIYIDALRAIPLITILFFGQLLIPLFLPLGFEINRVLRAVLAFSLFVSAYVAEDIRGGLQSIPNNQIEAAKTLGLSKFQINKFIVLPQALTIALPSLSNQAIGLLQNTSLMAILGLVELLGISRSILANPQFIGRYLEVYVWIAGVYWLICSIMALIARHIEHKMNRAKSNS